MLKLGVKMSAKYLLPLAHILKKKISLKVQDSVLLLSETLTLLTTERESLKGGGGGEG